MFVEDWTSIVVQFQKKVGSDLQDEELPAQFGYEDYQELLSAGMLRAEPLEQVISFAEAEKQDTQRADPPPPYGIHLNANAANSQEVHECCLQEHRRAPRKVRGHGERVAAGPAPAARTVSVLGPRTHNGPEVPEATPQNRKPTCTKMSRAHSSQHHIGSIACPMNPSSGWKRTSSAEKHVLVSRWERSTNCNE